MHVEGRYALLHQTQVVYARNVHVNIDIAKGVGLPATRVGWRSRAAVFTLGHPVHGGTRLDSVESTKCNRDILLKRNVHFAVYFFVGLSRDSHQDVGWRENWG